MLEFGSEDERNDYLRRRKRERVKKILQYGTVISVESFVPGWPKKASVTRSRGTKPKRQDGTSQRVGNMAADETPHAIDRARTLFKEVGLDLPPIPEELRKNFKEREAWCFSSRPVKMWPYRFDDYVEEAHSKHPSDYVLIAHAGHGVNSYAIHYYLVRGPLNLFLQLAWGGVYENQRKTTAAVNKCFKLAGTLLQVFEKKRPKGSHPGDRIIIVASDFYGSRWPGSGKTEKEVQDKKPVELLKLVLNSLSDS